MYASVCPYTIISQLHYKSHRPQVSFPMPFSTYEKLQQTCPGDGYDVSRGINKVTLWCCILKIRFTKNEKCRHRAFIGHYHILNGLPMPLLFKKGVNVGQLCNYQSVGA